VTTRTAAARYARALLDVARHEADPRAVGEELASFVALVERHEALWQAFANPSIPVQRKSALVRDLAGRARLSPPIAKLLALLAERDRLVLLPELLDEYRRRLLDHLGVVQAEVVTAVPLPPGRAEAMEQALAAMTGRTVSMSARVDPGLIGGVVTRIGSVVYDGSVKRHLEKVREALTQ
jgi:F-type H+-transporting ATPase subunit delta